MPTSIAAKTVASSCSLVARCQIDDERQQDPGRQRRERDDAVAGGVAVRVRDRHHVLVLVPRRRRSRRVMVAVEPGLGLQHEMEVEVAAVRLAESRRSGRGRPGRRPHRSAAQTGRPIAARQSRTRRLVPTSESAGVPASAPRLPGVAWVILRSTSALVQEAVSVGRPEHARGQPAGERAGGIRVVPVTLFPPSSYSSLLGLALRFIIAYVLLPGSGFPTDLVVVPGLEQRAGSPDAAGLLRQARLSRLPAGLPAVPVGARPAVFAARRHRRRGQADPDLRDLALAYVVYDMALELGASQRRAVIAAADRPGQPDHLVQQRHLGPGRRGRLDLPAARPAGSCSVTGASWPRCCAVVAALTKIQLGILGVRRRFRDPAAVAGAREGERRSRSGS